MNDEFDWQVDPATSPDALGGGIDVWGILYRRKWIMVATTILGVLLGTLYYSRQVPIYQSSAQVLIERKRPTPLPLSTVAVDYHASFADAFKHPVIMKSPNVVVDSLEKHQLGELEFLKKSGNPIQRVISGLQIKPATQGLGIYSVTFAGTDREGVGKVVNAVIAAYHDFLESTHRDVGRETRELLVEAKDELLRQLETKEQTYNSFREETPLMWKGSTATNVHQERQATYEGQHSDVLMQISDLETQLEAIQAYLVEGDNLEVLLMSAKLSNVEMTNPSPITEDGRPIDKSILLPLLLEEQELASRYGNDHPRIKSIRRRMDYTKNFYEKFVGVDIDEVASEDRPLAVPLDLGERIKKKVTLYVEALNHKLDHLRKRADRLDAMFESEQEAAKGLVRYQIKNEAHLKDIARTQQLFDAVVKRFEEISLVDEDYGGYTFEVLSAAGNGGKISPNLVKMITAAAVLGALAGFGLGFLVDLSDKSFRTPTEITGQLRLHVVGNIPLMHIDEPAHDSPLSGMLCTVHRSKSTQAEAFRTVRTALFFNTRGKRHQVLQVTSPTPGDGKSTLVANLAVTIANSGKSVLILDADFRKPVQHKLFGLESKIGLASVVDGQAEPHEAYQQVEGVPNLKVMACGPRPSNPSELLSSAPFRETLEYLREQFEFVIVDTPPLLAVSDPSAVAAQVDTVILTFRITKQIRPLARRARDILLETGADILGVVVNGIGPKDSQYGPGYGYGYGGKGYGAYAYRYGYGYGYGYGDDRAETTALTDDNGAARSEEETKVR